MRESRRKFLVRATAGVVGAAASSRVVTGQKPSPVPTPVAPQTPVAGMPPAFGTAPPVGPEITPTTVVEAQKFVRIEYTPAEQAQIAASWPRSMASTMERRTGPRKLALEETLEPATLWNPDDPRRARRSLARAVRRERREPGPAARPRRGHRLRPRDRAGALDPDPGPLLRATDGHLPGARGALRSEAPERDHPDPGPGARPSPAGGSGDRRGKVPRSAARRALRRERPSGHARDPDDVGRRALPQPGPGRRTPSSSIGCIAPEPS